jgi:hypothetical protein
MYQNHCPHVFQPQEHTSLVTLAADVVEPMEQRQRPFDVLEPLDITRPQGLCVAFRHPGCHANLTASSTRNGITRKSGDEHD